MLVLTLLFSSIFSTISLIEDRNQGFLQGVLISPVSRLAIVGGVSDGVIRGLVKAGAIEAVEVAIDDPFPVPDPDHDPPALEPAQAEAAAALRAAVSDAAFAPFLLDGVTGSGKTEVYFEAIAECLRQGRQALVLLPEIALTEPFLKRFEARFGCPPVAWHSDLRSSQRRRNWRGIATGEAKVPDKDEPGKLKVRFAPGWLSWLPWVWGNYWVIELGPEYQYSVIGDPGRDYFWILSREPEMDEATYQGILERAKEKGFDPARVVRTPQASAGS